jgi:hypothetical protein
MIEINVKRRDKIKEKTLDKLGERNSNTRLRKKNKHRNEERKSGRESIVKDLRKNTLFEQ